MNKIELVYWGEDNFSRPIWRDVVGGSYYGSTEILVPNRALAIDDVHSLTCYFRDNMDKICYFGETFNCEPAGDAIVQDKFILTGEHKSVHAYTMDGLIVTQKRRNKKLGIRRKNL